jgi:SOS-response transcriptional repressor LexA
MRHKHLVSKLDLEALQAALRAETKPNGQWSQRGLSLAAGGKADLVRDILRGENRNPSADILVGLARAMKRDLAEFVRGELTPAAASSPAPKIILKVTGAVAAGVWLEQTDWPPEEQYEVEVAPLEGAEAGLERFLVEMRGFSMDKTIPSGSVLDCVRVPYSDVVPQEGDIVIVERDAHDLTEMTCKRLARGPNGWELRPESTKPEFQEVIPIGDPDPESHADNGVRITGIVLEARQLHRRRRLR